MTPRFLHDNTCLLSNERGVTLLEILVTTIVLSVLVLTIYIGIEYAEKQSIQNYRNRAASLIVSGELERQYFINKFNARQDQNRFQVFNNREVVLDYIGRNQPLLAKHSVRRQSGTEFNGAQQYEFNYITSRVEWIDPFSGKTHFIQMREDYYKMVGI
jgi:prepilin-type N-terminal cleavage/methylation domain-containing protein